MIAATSAKSNNSVSDVERLRLQLDIEKFKWEQEESLRREEIYRKGNEDDVALRRRDRQLREEELEY